MKKAEREMKEIIQKMCRFENCPLTEINNSTEKFIKSILKECKIPINVQKIAEELDIKILHEDLNEYIWQFPISRRIGQYEGIKFTDGEKIICIDTKAAHNPATVQFATAYCIAYSFMTEDIAYYELMDRPTTLNMQIQAEKIALFITMPVTAVCEELEQFLKARAKSNEIPISSEKWIRYLSERACVSEYYATLGYQQVRMISCMDVSFQKRFPTIFQN